MIDPIYEYGVQPPGHCARSDRLQGVRLSTVLKDIGFEVDVRIEGCLVITGAASQPHGARRHGFEVRFKKSGA